MANIPRGEHPTPQFMREKWINLNGEWEFAFDFEKKLFDGQTISDKIFDKKIQVPFCPESELSGVQYKDFIPAIFYRKKLILTAEQLKDRVLLHFGAVDYKATVFVNGEKVGKHIGGYTPFQFDITKYVMAGENIIDVYVEDDTYNGIQCIGKQSEKPQSYECRYTRTTGIWQTVWIEFVPEKYIEEFRFYSSIENGSVIVTGETHGSGLLSILVYLSGRKVGETNTFSHGSFSCNILLSEIQLWEVGKGGLYDVEIRFENDFVSSYMGLRDIKIDGYKIKINGKSVFQRLVLDQGYYPTGIYTAPTDKDLEKDIILSMNAGFNGARLHEKVFEPRYLYHADRLGYLVWGEYPDWGIAEYNNGLAITDMLIGWTEALKRDFNHPSIIGWCPFNETWKYIEQETGLRVLETFYKITKQIDSTRPVIDASGNYHSFTDIYDLHDYDQNPQTFEKRYSSFEQTGDFHLSDDEADGKPFFRKHYEYRVGMPVFVSEYGGIRWDAEINVENDLEKSWGYGEAPKTKKEFLARYKGLTEVLMKNKNMFGFCYTQLYDVEQEKNGLYTCEREPKFEMQEIREININIAEIEKE